MWIFTSNEFLSVVRHRDKPEHLMIRFRSRAQAEACTLDGEITITPTADYVARKTVRESDFVSWMITQTAELQYDNYKNSTQDTLMHEAPLMKVWQCMYDWQNETEYGSSMDYHPSSAFWHDYNDDAHMRNFCEDCWSFHDRKEECLTEQQKEEEPSNDQ